MKTFLLLVIIGLVAAVGCRDIERGTGTDSMPKDTNSQASSDSIPQPGPAFTISTMTDVATSAAPGMAPDFSWKTPEGTIRSLKDYRGKVVMINFWATWCGPCKRELPDIVEVRGEFLDRGFEVIGVNVGERTTENMDIREHIFSYAEEYGLNYPLVLGSVDIMQAYGGIESIPTTVIVGRNGEIIQTFVGAQDAGTFRSAVARAVGR